MTTQAKLSERGNVQDNINNISSNTCDGIFIPTQDIIDKLQNSIIQMNNYNTSLDSVFNTVGIRISENFYLKFEPELISKVNTLATKLENKINIQSGLPQMLANPNTRIENLTQKYESVNNYNNNLESDGIFCDKMKINSNNLTDRLNKLVKLVGDRTSLITRINNSKTYDLLPWEGKWIDKGGRYYGGAVHTLKANPPTWIWRGTSQRSIDKLTYDENKVVMTQEDKYDHTFNVSGMTSSTQTVTVSMTRGGRGGPYYGNQGQQTGLNCLGRGGP